MKKILVTGILLFSFIIISGQAGHDSIVVKQRIGPVFLQNNRPLVPGQLMEITKSNQEAYSEMKIAHTNYFASIPFQYAGGFLIGYPIGTAIAGGDANWTLAALGVGLLGISIPFITAYNKHAKKAVAIYNRGLRPPVPVPDLRLGFTGYGPGLKIRF
jgi:hypothetical protein